MGRDPLSPKGRERGGEAAKGRGQGRGEPGSAGREDGGTRSNRASPPRSWERLIHRPFFPLKCERFRESAALPGRRERLGVCACARPRLCVLLSLSSQMSPQLSLHCSGSSLARALSSPFLPLSYLSPAAPPSFPLSSLLTQQPGPRGGGGHSFSPRCVLRARSPLRRIGSPCALGSAGGAVWICPGIPGGAH